uniref:Phosphoribosyltransferase domain-containing protein n=1 Tax=Knipowitschia caucasica TaxID=637954 RepID=A0AAV2IZR7_KNICA
MHLRLLFERLKEHGLIINSAKCEFGRSSITFLGHHVTPQGVMPLPAKVKAIIDFPRPNTVKPLQEFLGMVIFYNRHLPREMTGAFEATKTALANATLLAHPSPTAPVALTTDASLGLRGWGCVRAVGARSLAAVGLFQQEKLRSSERKYSTFDRELLGLFLATRHFRFLLEGRQFTAFVDHKPLIFAMAKSTEPWLATTSTLCNLGTGLKAGIFLSWRLTQKDLRLPGLTPPDSTALADCVKDLLEPFHNDSVDIVAGIDAMGFILGACVATTLGKGFLAIRKAGHLCVDTQSQNYRDYSGRDKTMEVRLDVLKAGVRVLLVDQWIETGGTMKAAIELVERFGATVVGVAAVAIENTEGGQWIKKKYKFSHCIPEELQSQIDQKYLDSFKVNCVN